MACGANQDNIKTRFDPALRAGGIELADQADLPGEARQEIPAVLTEHEKWS